MPYRDGQTQRVYQAEWARKKRRALHSEQAEMQTGRTVRQLLRQKNVMELHLSGWSTRQVAEALNIGLGTVSSDLREETCRRQESGELDFRAEGKCPQCGHEQKLLYFIPQVPRPRDRRSRYDP